MANKIKLAQIEDIDGMLDILNKNWIFNQESKSTEELESSGFLVNPFTYEDIVTQLKNNDFIILVSKNDDNVEGYIIDYTVNPDEFAWIRESGIPIELQNKLLNEKTLYHRHIGIDPACKGIGKKLMETLIDMAIKKAHKNIICQIALSPVENKKSIVFHEKLGFEMIGKCKDDVNDFIFGIFWKKL
jgi:L-amino acid N-acyltransferase YncA